MIPLSTPLHNIPKADLRYLKCLRYGLEWRAGVIMTFVFICQYDDKTKYCYYTFTMFLMLQSTSVNTSKLSFLALSFCICCYVYYWPLFQKCDILSFEFNFQFLKSTRNEHLIISFGNICWRNIEWDSLKCGYQVWPLIPDTHA
jgi:hypothetical protein